MEREKKRKRADHHHLVEVKAGCGGERRRKEEESGVMAVQPTEEEVEEFFSILRSMNVAVKYFEKGQTAGGDGNVNGDGLKLTALEGAVVNGVKIGGESKAGAGGTGLDLNEVPGADT